MLVQWVIIHLVYIIRIEKYQTHPFDFLSDVVYQWERFAKRFESFGASSTWQMILSNDGALQTMKLPYKFFVGGKRIWIPMVFMDSH